MASGVVSRRICGRIEEAIFFGAVHRGVQLLFLFHNQWFLWLEVGQRLSRISLRTFSLPVVSCRFSGTANSFGLPPQGQRTLSFLNRCLQLRHTLRVQLLLKISNMEISCNNFRRRAHLVLSCCFINRDVTNAFSSSPDNTFKCFLCGSLGLVILAVRVLLVDRWLRTVLLYCVKRLLGKILVGDVVSD